MACKPVGFKGMQKKFTVNDVSELTELVSRVKQSMTVAGEQLAATLSDNGAEALFAKCKFGGIGCDPLDQKRPLNFVEQINQSYTYLASFYATELLFKLHPELAPFRLNLGTSSGSDIESKCGNVAAEVFAAVSPSSNQKLKKDIAKVAETDAVHKYVFFMCPKFSAGRQIELEVGEVKVWSLGEVIITY